MNLAVITCAAYSDCWPAFFALLEKFWPDHPEVDLLTDKFPKYPKEPPDGANMMAFGSARGAGVSWCEVLKNYAEITEEPFLLMQEDFLLSAPVREDVLAAKALMRDGNIGCVRLYPCPGPADGRTGHIERGERYRISLQAAIWSPTYLRHLLAAIPSAKTAADFELMGTPASAALPGDVMSWGREDTPWPIEYICSAITRGKWNPDAKRLCDQHGIEVDWTRREMCA